MIPKRPAKAMGQLADMIENVNDRLCLMAGYTTYNGEFFRRKIS